MGTARKTQALAPNYCTEVRANAAASTTTGVKDSSSTLYAPKWKQFKASCLDAKLQEGFGDLNVEEDGQSNDSIIGKIFKFVHYKVVEEGCDTAEVKNIRSSLNSIYNKKFQRIGEWKVREDGATEGNPTNSIMVMEAL